LLNLCLRIPPQDPPKICFILRHLCAGDTDFYNRLSEFNCDEEAGRRPIYHRSAHIVHTSQQSCESGMIFLQIRNRILLFSWFRSGVLLKILHDFFSKIIIINFNIVFLSCRCVKLHMYHKLFKGIFYQKEFNSVHIIYWR